MNIEQIVEAENWEEPFRCSSQSSVTNKQTTHRWTTVGQLGFDVLLKAYPNSLFGVILVIIGPRVFSIKPWDFVTSIWPK